LNILRQILQPVGKQCRIPFQCKQRVPACDCVSFSVYEYVFSLTAFANRDTSKFTEAFDDLEVFYAFLKTAFIEIIALHLAFVLMSHELSF
jgi:hypothetical protein